MKKTISLLLAAVMLICLLASCGGKTGDSAQSGGNTASDSQQPANDDNASAQPEENTGDTAQEDTRGDFVFGDYVGTVDPAAGAYSWVGMRTGVMESLFKFDENLNVQKNLVEDYSVSDDGMVWTIVLKDGILFQSGNVCDAEAVKASFERTCSLQTRADGELKIASMEADG
ncbi:MAG: hypothetical protein IJ072_05445, partial [Oscillospiraceae bacterium]|nr:hypothetical protein [Oscillospiraceae bacterium]